MTPLMRAVGAAVEEVAVAEEAEVVAEEVAGVAAEEVVEQNNNTRSLKSTKTRSELPLR